MTFRKDEGIMMREPWERPIPILWDIRYKDGRPYAIEKCRVCKKDIRIMSLREFHEDFAMDKTCRSCRRKESDAQWFKEAMMVGVAVVLVALAFAAMKLQGI